MNHPKIDGLRPAYYNATEDRYLSIVPTYAFDEWEPVLILSANGGLDTVTLTAATAAWLLPEFAKLASDYARFMERQIAASKERTQP
jgi:hypothetical protein